MSNDLNNLIIIISHLHKDHYSDLASIGYASYVYKKLGYLNTKIKVYIPDDDMINCCESYIDSDGWGASRHVIKHIQDFEYLMNFGEENYLDFVPYCCRDKIKHGDMVINFIKNIHQLTTYSVKIINNNNTIVYSADTGYKNNMLDSFSKNADLLICESSFLRGQYKDDDNHLYAYEAALIAQKAMVKELMLTHFWPEIDKQKYVEEARTIFENTIAAEEGKKLVLRRK